MPRARYTPKNRYVRNSNLSEPDFCAILWLYLHGAPTHDVHGGAWQHIGWPDTTAPPSTKTLSKLYRKLGRYLFMKIMEPVLLIMFPKMKAVKETDPENFEDFLMTMAETIHKHSMDDLGYESFRIVNEGKPMMFIAPELAMEVRRLSASRQGIKHDPIPDIGLANFKYITAKRVGKGLTNIEQITLMHKSLLKILEDDPL